jgi:methionyl-tRNA formyltransferase
MEGNFSLPPFQALLEHEIEVCAIAIPAAQDFRPQLPAISEREQLRPSRFMLPMFQSPLQMSLLRLAWEKQIPVWEVRNLSDPETISVLAAYQADMICVACFSLRIPRVILDLPRLGCINVHPSLLPANRGPVPLFWTFHEGHQQIGVTIHLMDEGMDTGDILAQEQLAVPDGFRYEELELQCARRGGELLAQAVWSLYKGEAVRTPQDEMKSSYFPFPDEDDFVVPAVEWDACRVYNFIRGVANWDGPVTLLVDNQRIFVRDVISYSLMKLDNIDDEMRDNHGEVLRVQCKDGWVIVRV